jgi:hypothetical protein
MNLSFIYRQVFMTAIYTKQFRTIVLLASIDLREHAE